MEKENVTQNETQTKELTPGYSEKVEYKPYAQRYQAPTLSEIINARMHELQITQKELGKRLGVSQTYVSRLCRGLVRHPQLSTICRIEEALDLKIVSDFERAANAYQQGSSDVPVALFPESLAEEMLKNI